MKQSVEIYILDSYKKASIIYVFYFHHIGMNVLFVTDWIPERYKKLHEKDITSWVWKQIRDDKWFFYKISDNSADLKPCDAVVNWKVSQKYINWIVEFKISKNKWKINIYSLLRPNQIQWLLLYKKNGWGWYVALYSTEKNLLYRLDIEDVINDKVLFI